ncbi:NYN domain-containing protein [Micromonospora sp. NPDC049559]|uniref:NYN domain-containing protein n=1 Tax=Micromonospora sp. NPDC049559 TaxID=3155923 RepID=UPI00343DB426
MYIGLRNSSPDAAAAFATDPSRWVRWMEQDLGPFRVDDEETPRMLLRRICYLEPSHSGKFRSYFTRAGFRVVDCPSLTSMGKNSADIHMVLDILDTLTHPTRFDDFVVLSTDADFTPVFMRLREHDRTSGG